MQSDLGALENLLEGFLDQLMAHKSGRVRILEGMISLDSVVRNQDMHESLEQLGGWMAENRSWLESTTLRTSDKNRILHMLEAISLSSNGGSPESDKLSSELSRWKNQLRPSGGLTLKRGPEQVPTESSPLAQFTQVIRKELDALEQMTDSQRHPLTIAENLINSAQTARDKGKLSLAAALLYHLRLQGYLTGPYVAKLKEAERIFGREGSDAHAR